MTRAKADSVAMPHVDEGDDGTRFSSNLLVTVDGQRILSRYLLLFGGVTVLTLAVYLTQVRFDIGIAAGLIILFNLAAAWVLLRYQRFHASLLCAIWGTWLIIMFFSFLVSGLRTPFMIVVPVMVMSAGWMLNSWHAKVMAGASLLVLLIMASFHELGWLKGLVERTHWQIFITYSSMMLVTGVVAAHTSRSFRREYGKALQLARNLENKVEQRTADLRQALEHLQRAQDELVESEKLASLGGLVAGVAHEINTPIGVAVTASSHLAEEAEVIRCGLAAGGLRRSDLDSFIATASEASRIIEANLARAARLITSFKKVSVDRASEARHDFDLRQTLSHLLETLEPMWKRQPVAITLSCPEGIILNSYPGPLGQVVSNLLQNAVTHAFPDNEDGRIEVSARTIHEDAEIAVCDNGIGVTDDTLNAIFEPFYTTARESGGTGLGMPVAKNIVFGLLGGSIQVERRISGGLCVRVRIPRIAPQPAEV